MKIKSTKHKVTDDPKTDANTVLAAVPTSKAKC